MCLGVHVAAKSHTGQRDCRWTRIPSHDCDWRSSVEYVFEVYAMDAGLRISVMNQSSRQNCYNISECLACMADPMTVHEWRMPC
jgi:hypothetical protein